MLKSVALRQMASKPGKKPMAGHRKGRKEADKTGLAAIIVTLLCCKTLNSSKQEVDNSSIRCARPQATIRLDFWPFPLPRS